MRYLCRLPQNLSLKDETGNTALHHACKRDKARMVYNLLLMNANKALKNSDGLTAYEVAQLNQNSTIMNLFVR